MERIRQHKAALVNQRLDAHNADLVRTDVINSWLNLTTMGWTPIFIIMDRYWTNTLFRNDSKKGSPT